MKRSRSQSFDPVYPYFYTQTSITNGALVVTGVRTGNSDNSGSDNLVSSTIIDAPLFLINGHLGLTYGSGLEVFASTLQVTTGNGLIIDAQGNVAVKCDAPLTADDGSLTLLTGNGLQINNNALTLNTGPGLTYNNGATQLNLGAGLQFGAGDTVTVKSKGPIYADADAGLDIAVGNGLSTSNNILQVATGLGLQIANNKLQVAPGTALTALPNGLNVNIGPGLRITDTNAVAVRAGGGLYINNDGTLQVNTGGGLQVQNNILSLKIGTGLTIASGVLMVTNNTNPPDGGGTGNVTVPLNAVAPLSYTDGTLSLSFTDEFIVQSGTLSLQLTVSAPLVKKDNKISLNIGSTLSVSNGALESALQTTSPLSLNDNNLSLNYGNGLTLSTNNLSVVCEEPLVCGTAGISLQIGEGLAIKNGALAASNSLTISASAPLQLSGNDLSLQINPPFTVSGNKLSLNATRGLTMLGANLTVQVSSPLVIGNSGVQLSYSPFFTNNSANQLAPAKYCCVVSGVIPYPVVNFGNSTQASFLLVLERVGAMVHGMMRLMDCFIPFTLNKFLILHMSTNGDIVVPNSSYRNSNTVFYNQQLIPYGNLNSASVWKQGIVPGPVGVSENYLPPRSSTPIGLLINSTGSKYLPRTLTFALNIQYDTLLHNMEPFFFSYMPLY